MASMGGVTSLPYLAMFAMSNVGGWMGEWLITSRGWKVVDGRKAVNTIGREGGKAKSGKGRRGWKGAEVGAIG